MRTGPWVWPGAAALLVVWAWRFPEEPLVLTPVRALPGVGPEGPELVAASVALLLVLGGLDLARSRLWDRIERGAC